jgi:hypothetical protein
MVLGLDGEEGALLMEAIVPGATLSEGTEAVRPGEIVDLVGELHAAPG